MITRVRCTRNGVKGVNKLAFSSKHFHNWLHQSKCEEHRFAAVHHNLRLCTKLRRYTSQSVQQMEPPGTVNTPLEKAAPIESIPKQIQLENHQSRHPSENHSTSRGGREGEKHGRSFSSHKSHSENRGKRRDIGRSEWRYVPFASSELIAAVH